MCRSQDEAGAHHAQLPARAPGKPLLHLKGGADAIHSNHVCTGWYLLGEACCEFSWTASIGSKSGADDAYPTA